MCCGSGAIQPAQCLDSTSIPCLSRFVCSRRPTASGTGPGMMRARNAGREEVHLRGCSMRSWVLRLVTVVFASQWLAGFAAMHTLVQDPTPTGPALDTEPGTIPANQANQLNPPPPHHRRCRRRTNSNASCSDLNTTTRICATHTRTQRRPGPLAHEHSFAIPSSQTPNARGRQEPATSHASSTSSTSRPQRKKWVSPRARQCARSSRPRTAKSGCGATV